MYRRLLAMFHELGQIEYGLGDLRNGITGESLLQVNNQILLVNRSERERENKTENDGLRKRERERGERKRERERERERE